MNTANSMEVHGGHVCDRDGSRAVVGSRQGKLVVWCLDPGQSAKPARLQTVLPCDITTLAASPVSCNEVNCVASEVCLETGLVCIKT